MCIEFEIVNFLRFQSSLENIINLIDFIKSISVFHILIKIEDTSNRKDKIIGKKLQYSMIKPNF